MVKFFLGGGGKKAYTLLKNVPSHGAPSPTTHISLTMVSTVEVTEQRQMHLCVVPRTKTYLRTVTKDCAPCKVGRVLRHHFMKSCGGVEIRLHVFLTPVLDRGKWLPWRISLFAPKWTSPPCGVQSLKVRISEINDVMVKVFLILWKIISD